MIKKERALPIRLRQLMALAERIDPRWPDLSKITKDLSNQQAGYHGEQYLDAITSPFLSPHFHTFRDLKLSVFHGTETIQIDQLHLTPHFALIIEAKNITGEIEFEQKFKQMRRMKDDEVQYFTNPTLQVERQKEGLQLLFDGWGITLPIYTQVVFTSSNVYFTVTDEYEEVRDTVCKSDQITSRIRRMLLQNKETVLTKRQLTSLCSKLLSLNVQDEWRSVVSRYGLEEWSIQKGVWCVECKTFSMVRGNRSWACTRCNRWDRHAHQKALDDYFLLMSPSLTNRDARAFLGLDCNRTTHGLLKAMNLKHTGKTYNRVYLSPFHRIGGAGEG
ncbi:NERD domain-containing protein [Jeotgalibacillus sp. S-D1]|uniref:nuclease-related domain-containing protein n=1 Tax=Jeotgalibacillus sp. S-D1 TaxID=2552189 RepID=UPI00105A3BC5|nr:nuclease-related domain-containing protein [Jeotgalibacillus sp. S-D1]TDL32850.1 NERD domain-containing protein [Jeotgalibacillus sp. S-D1]